MYNTMITLALLLDAYLWLVVVDKIWCRLSERSERKTDERRQRYREPAYKQMNKRWTQRQNRESLWKVVNK
jgi:hypothetical protein